MKVNEINQKKTGNNNPIKNFCWPLKGKDQEKCVQGYEDVFEEEEDLEQGPEETGPG